jgi:hypothetical protein
MYSTHCSEPNTIAMAVMISGDNACSLHAYGATKLALCNCPLGAC